MSTSFERQSAPIAIYDSGVGGLSIVRAIQQRLPHESIHYIADTKHLPLGEKTEEVIVTLVQELIDFCLAHRYKLLILACNTASAAFLELVSWPWFNHQRLPIFNVIDPLVGLLQSTTGNQSVGLVATRYTVESSVYQKRLQRANGHLSIFPVPEWVMMVEDSFMHGVDHALIDHYLDALFAQAINLIALGCTHYIFLKSHIRQRWHSRYGQDIEIIEPSLSMAEKLSIYLKQYNLANNNPQLQTHRFMATSLRLSLQQAVEQLFQQPVICLDRFSSPVHRFSL